MSWPADGQPRYKPGSIGNGSTGDTNPKPTSSTRPIAIARAQAEAAYLNANPYHNPRPVFWPRLPGEHNATGYERGGCRCQTCTTAYIKRRQTSRNKKQTTP